MTLPVVAAGSIQMSTDTVLFPFMALSLAIYLRLLQRPSTALALACGFALGIGFLAKYAAIYYLLCGGIAALLVSSARPGWRNAALIVLGFVVAASPNLIWNILNGFTTVEHTMDNADWVRDPNARAGLNFDNLGNFFGAQFAVFGPILMLGLLWQPLRDRHHPRALLQLMALPIIALVCVQALLSNAYANWAASAYLAGTLAVVPWLTRRWLIGSFVLNGAFCLAVPVLTLFADDLKMFTRYTGLNEMSETLIQVAEEAGVEVIVANRRNILADLHYTGRDRGLNFYAVPPQGRAMNHYEKSFPLPEDLTGPVLLAVAPASVPACAADADLIKDVQPETGAYRRGQLALYRVDATCAAQHPAR